MNDSLAIPTFLDRRKVVWSYSFLHAFDDVCAYQAYRTYIKRDIPYVETVARAKGNRVHKAMDQRIKGQALPDDCREYEKFAVPFDGKNPVSEQKLGVTAQGKPVGFFDNAAWGRGTLDVTLINHQTAYIADWKTGRSDYEKPFELQVHAVLLHAKHPHLKTIKGQFIYLGENRTSVVYDLSDTRHTWKVIGDIMSNVERNLQTQKFEKRQGPLCKYCSVKDCEWNRNRGGV